MRSAIRLRLRCSRSIRISAIPTWRIGTSASSGTWASARCGRSRMRARRARRCTSSAMPTSPCHTADPDADVDPRRPRPFLGQRPHLLVLLRQFELSLAADQSRKAVFQQPELPHGLHVRQVDRRAVASLARLQQQQSVRSEYNYRQEKGPSDYNQSHRFVASYSYDLPFGRKLKGAAKVLARRLAVHRHSLFHHRYAVHDSRPDGFFQLWRRCTSGPVPGVPTDSARRTEPPAVVQPGGVSRIRGTASLRQRRPQYA